MRFSLAHLARQVRNPRRSRIPIRPIKPPHTLAQELFTITRAVPDAWKAGEGRIAAAYARALAAITHDSADDAGSTIDDIAQEIEALILRLSPRLRDWTMRVERWHRSRWTANVLSATSVDLGTILSANDVAETVAASLQWNASLVADVSAEARRRITAAVFDGLQQRKPAADVAKAIAAVTGMARDRSLRIASDQSVKLAARLDQARQEQAGIADYIWQHSHKLHPRPVHLHRNGMTFSWSEPPPDGPPGTLPYCGCVAKPILSLED